MSQNRISPDIKLKSLTYRNGQIQFKIERVWIERSFCCASYWDDLYTADEEEQIDITI